MFDANTFTEFVSGINEVDDRDLLVHLIDNGILNKLGLCPKCRNQRRLGKNSRYKEGYAIHCPRRNCKYFRSLFEGTFFEGTQLPLKTTLQLMYCWGCGFSQEDTVRLTGVCKWRFNQYYRWLRDIASGKILNAPDLFLFGGPGVVVQIDESVIARRKQNVRRRVRLQWVLGIWDTQQKRGLVRFVKKRDAATLLPIIREHVIPGTEIWTDCWRAYNRLRNMGYTHRNVNHSRNFVDPVPRCCTNGVEGMWAALKRHLRKRSLMWSPLIAEHIDEWMWRKAYGINANNGLNTILAHIAQRYPQQ